MNKAKISQILLVPPILLGIYLITVNLAIFDEDLKPEINSLLESAAMPANKDNAYIALLGLKSDESQNMFYAGEQIVANYQRQLENPGDFSDSIGEYGEYEIDKSLDAFWLEALDGCNDRIDDSCLKPHSEKLKNIQTDSARLNALLNRYQQLLLAKDFSEIDNVSFNMPTPAYIYAIKLGKIQIINLYNAKNYSAMLRQIKADMAFWRMVLRQGKSLIAKMVAVSRIWGNIEYMSELLKEESLSSADLQLVKELASPLTRSELDIGKSFVWEFRHTIYFFENLPLSEKLISQTNASVNTSYELTTAPLICLSKLDASKFGSFYNDWKQSKHQEICNIQSSRTDHFSNLLNLYNIAGRVHLPESSELYASDYIARVRDLNGMFKLLKLKLDLRNAESLSIEQLSRLTSKNSEFDDYTIYINDENKLGFECLSKGVGKGSTCHLSL